MKTYREEVSQNIEIVCQNCMYLYKDERVKWRLRNHDTWFSDQHRTGIKATAIEI